MRLIHKNEKGMVLPLGLMFLAIIAIMGTTAVIVTTTDLKIGSNYMAGEQAFYDAEAGVQYAIAMIENGLGDDTLALSGSSVTVKYTAPPGFSFDTITTLTQVGTTSNYSFQVIGHSGNANSAIEVVFVRDALFQYGVFGNEKLHMKNDASVYSYDSSGDPLPLLAMPVLLASTHEGDVGSNEEVRVNKGTFIDGNVGLGDDDMGNEADYEEAGGVSTLIPSPTGQIEDVPRVNPDPLGAIGGDLADKFILYSDNVNNDNVAAGIAGNAISLPPPVTVPPAPLSMTLTAGNYYLDSIELKAGAILNIDGSGGEVNIYLTGILDAENLSCINIINGHPKDFTIYSNSDKKIDYKSATKFRGTIYAPYADLDVEHCAGIYGMIWANNVDIKSLAMVCCDTALKNEWPANTVTIVSWKEILN